ncbi:hypothetical protein [Halorussus salinisoli]|uniref:hypothetical protein n=1 Tax=Halorussus salinisoli TaxID=2558242 RepID=UPI0010C21F9E|nr:hypothetical protein [Halorussus salinisoli]
MLSREIKVISGYTVIVGVIFASVINWQTPQNYDNGIRIWLLTQQWAVLLSNITVIELAPPLWHIFGKFGITLSPLSPILTLRIMNLLLFLIMIPTGYYAGRMLGSQKAGWGTALILPWSTYLISFITRTDHYILYASLAVIYTAILASLISNHTRTKSLLFALTTAAFAFTHYYALTYIAGTVFAAVALKVRVHGWQKVMQTTYNDAQQRRFGLYGWFKSPSVVPLASHLFPSCFLYLLWMPRFYKQIIHYHERFSSAYSSLTELVITAILFIGRQLPTFAPIDEIRFSLGIGIVVVFTVPIGFIGLVNSFRNPNQVRTTIIGGAFIGAGILLMTGRFYSPRHGLWMAAIAPIILGLGMEVIATKAWKSPIILDRYSAIQVIGIILIISISAVPALATINETTEIETDVNRAADVVQNSYTANSVILSSHPKGEMILRAYGVEAPIHGVPEDSIKEEKAVRVRGDYHPDTHPNDFRRIQRLTEGKNRVILFDARGTTEQLLSPLKRDLKTLGYKLVEEYREGANGVIIFER